jgi:hypothetical protein
MNTDRIEPRSLEGGRSLGLEERAPIQTRGQESWMNSKLRSLASIGFKLRRFSSTV